MTVQKRRYYQAVLAVALGALAFTQAGNVLSARPVASFLPAAYAQEFTDTDVANYANAVVEMEATRIEAYAMASDILLAATEGEVDILSTPLSCRAANLSDMPESLPKPDKVDLQAALVEFCKSARLTAENNQLTAKRFNRLTAAHREDPALAERIQAAIADLRSPAEPPAAEE